MSRLRILVLDNEERWRQEVLEALEGLGAAIDADSCDTLATARGAIEAKSLDLAVVDLSLLEVPREPEDLEREGVEFLRSLRSSRRNCNCAVVVLSGYLNTERTNRLKDLYQVQAVSKNDFSDDALCSAVRDALRAARIHAARVREEQEPCVTVELGDSAVRRTSVTGELTSNYVPPSPVPVAWEAVAGYADLINAALRQPQVENWRAHADNAGEILAENLATDVGLRSSLMSARTSAVHGARNARFRFEAPPAGLAIPFELMRFSPHEPHLCLEGPVSRRIAFLGFNPVAKAVRFDQCIEGLWKAGKPLRALLIAANVDGDLPAVEVEAQAVADRLERDFSLLGVEVSTRILGFEEATWESIRLCLEEGSYHLLHYAGHGLHASGNPELSGVVLRHGDGTRTLTSGQLYHLVESTGLQLVFLSSCLGARVSSPDGSEYRGVFDALVRAGIPTVLGHRWVVNDSSACYLADAFYRALSQSLSPREALFEARKNCVIEHGMDDAVWASPILVVQHQ